ncbi:hypothetical protein [Streptomyces racemochromogenes]|uniref:hypothetical protein n=1 Tax=Streptomyces racemochromogenes TaxID=67353 RepID=UPI0031EBF617
MQRTTLLRRRSAGVRAAVRRGLAGTALATSAALLAGLISAAPASAVEIPPDDEPQYRPISLGSDPRRDRCAAGFALHIGGPEMKKVASKALAGTTAELNAATAMDPQTGQYPLYEAMLKDRDSREGSPVESAERRERWEKANYPYWESGTKAGIPQYAPKFDEDIVAFTLGPQRALYYQLGGDGHSTPSKAALDKAKALAEELKGQDLNNDFVTKDLLGDTLGITTGSDVARYLRLGGYMKQAPPEGSVEFRLEVEALKASWGACDSRNPVDFYRVMSPIVVTAHMEWEQEYATQAAPRNEIVNAEVTAAGEARKATEAMIESLGQAWLADQILTWQKYWAGQPANASGRPAASVFTQANKDLAAARTRAADQAKVAATASAAAKAASAKAGTAQTTAWALADAAKAPRGRGLLFAQQSVQVTKASAAAAEAAAKAAETASNAAKATVADSKTLYALAQTQSHAMNTEFRRVAAQEAAAQAKAAAESAAAQAKEAADNATKAKAAQTKAETARDAAKTAADNAKAQRIKAEQERDVAKAEHAKATAERNKALAAEKRATTEREAAAKARTAAETAGSTAADKLDAAEAAEQRAALARDAAAQAERDLRAKDARAAALESAAAAAEGTAAAGDSRKAATEARTAANTAKGAADRARTAADEAGSAAVEARAAATRAEGAAARSQAAYENANAQWWTSYAAAQTAHAAAAEAIDASDAASANAVKAEAEAKKAQAASAQTKKEAAAAQDEAEKTSAWSAVTAGHAYATAQAAAAARDSAAEAVKPANTAIATGTPYRESDSAAAFAVLVGQSAKSLAEQQAAAATAKSDEATKAAAAAKALADKATGDAKLAAQASAAAAADTAAALKSVAAARASAATAAKAAAAAKAAETKATEYNSQAGAEVVLAGNASRDAASEAAAANSEATEAEKSAANARTAANAAKKDSDAANGAATKAESDAKAAEGAAANAQQSAKDADASADRAEEALRKWQEEQRAAQLAAAKSNGGPGYGGADLNLTQEEALRKACGQACVDEYKAALEAANKDVIDWVIENGGQILLDVLGVTAAKKCFSSGDVESCLWTALNVVLVGALVLKIPQVAVAVTKVAIGLGGYFRATAAAVQTLARLKPIAQVSAHVEFGAYTTTTAATEAVVNMKRAMSAGGWQWTINTGHGFHRAHSYRKGEQAFEALSTTHLTADQIEKALILKTLEHMGAGGSMEGLQKLYVTIDGIKIKGHIMKVGENLISISTYVRVG